MSMNDGGMPDQQTRNDSDLDGNEPNLYMACIVMAYIDMAYTVMAYESRPYTYGLCSYGLRVPSA